jgi:ribosome maturation factor RimP
VADQNAAWAAAEPILSSLGLELVDVEVIGSGRARTLRLTVDRDGGVDLDTLAGANRPVSVALEAVDALSGPYTLELSSPGLERPLRRPAEFRRFVGTPVSVKTHEPISGARRHRGLLVEADESGIALDVDGEQRTISYGEIASARTVFEWGPAPKPTGPAKRAAGRSRPERPAKERSV